MLKRHFVIAQLSATAGILSLMTACGTSPNAMAPMTSPQTLAPKQPVADAVPGKIVVKLKNGMTTQSVNGLMHIQSIEGLNNTSLYSVQSGETVEAALAKLRKDPNVVYAEPDYRYHAYDYHAKATVNDPKFSQLWGIQKIQAPAAWDITTGDPNVVVAVVDTGVDYNHPDLQGQVIKGPDFANNDNDPMDDQGHGSHVAGTIAAIGNNGTGVVGIAYKTKILAIKVL
ncbi:MAG TPA: S8 family serine peptidase, partial [Stenomitos sp.]